MNNIKSKLKEFKESLLKDDLGIDEIFGYIEYLFEDDEDSKKINKTMQEYTESFYQMFNECCKFNKIKEIMELDNE